MNACFVTGATGALGSAIVPLLLDEPNTEVRLLLRAESQEVLQRRVSELIGFWGLSDYQGRLKRLKAIRGDVRLPRFGLAELEYAQLAAECTRIFHCAGSVRMNLPLKEARRSAVGSAQEICALARQLAAKGRLRKVEFVSTVGVAGRRPGALPEAWLNEPRTFHNTYEQSKAEAEEIVRRAIEVEGLPLTVHRPSMVIGDSRDGRIIHFQIFYFLCDVLSGRKTMGIHPAFGDAQLDLIPVDWVAEAIVACSRDPATAGRILHVCSGPTFAPTLEQVKATVRQVFASYGLSLPRTVGLPRAWCVALARSAARFASEKRRKSLATLPMYLDYLRDRQGFNNASYSAWLNGRGLSLPRPADYLPRVLGYYLDKRYGKHPSPRPLTDAASA